MLTSLLFRRINFANATPHELEQLTQACEEFDGAYCKAGKMDPESFSSSLDPFRTDLIKIIRDYFLEGKESAKMVEIETCKLNTYSAHFNLHSPLVSDPILLSRQRLVFQASCQYPTEQEDVRFARDRLSNASRGWGSVPTAPRSRMDLRSWPGACRWGLGPTVDWLRGIPQQY